jgi:cell cycle checkpoint protein
LFDEFEYTLEDIGPDDEDQEGESATAFGFQLHTLLECLNIFGTAFGPTSSHKANKPNWRRTDAPDNDEQDTSRGGLRAGQSRTREQDIGNARIDSFFPRAEGKGTGMRLSYDGQGYPLSLLLYVTSWFMVHGSSFHTLVNAFKELKVTTAQLQPVNLPHTKLTSTLRFL